VTGTDVYEIATVNPFHLNFIQLSTVFRNLNLLNLNACKGQAIDQVEKKNVAQIKSMDNAKLGS
jgi:hypothetical protein